MQAVWSCQDQPVSALGKLGSLTLCEVPHRCCCWTVQLYAGSEVVLHQGLCLKECWSLAHMQLLIHEPDTTVVLL